MKSKTYYRLILLLSVVFATLEPGAAWGQDAQAPGLPIAHLALPTISSTAEALVPTHTLVGSKVAEIKEMLREVHTETTPLIQKVGKEYENVILEANQYHKSVGEIEAKLQLGTTPANPQLVEIQSKTAQQLNQLTHILEGLKRLSQELRNLSQQTQIISAQAQQALSLPGAVDEDHAQLLLIRQELAQLNEKICQILNIMVANIGRQSQWLVAERLHFEDLSLGIERGRLMTLSPRMMEIQKEILPLKPIALPKPKPHYKAPPAPKKKFQKGASSKKFPSPKKPTPRAVTASPKPLPTVAVQSRPKIPTVQQEVPANQEAPVKLLPKAVAPTSQVMDYPTAAKGRSPLGVLNADEDVQSQKWYLFASASRGLSNPADIVDIVTVVDQTGSSKKGEEVKAILIQLGIKPAQIRLNYATGEPDQMGKVYIFGQ